MMALLSLSFERWQSVHCLVSRAPRPRTVCGTLVLKAMPRIALGRDRLLLDVDRLAVGVVRADVDRARRAGRADPVAGHVAVAGEHEDVVAQRLEVVRRVVARHVAVVVELRHLDVGLLRQVAAEAARVPRRVAGDAAHVALLYARSCPLAGVGRPRPCWSPSNAHGLGQVPPSRCSAAGRVDRVGRLHHFPAQVLLDHRVLEAPHRPSLRIVSNRGLPNGVRSDSRFAPFAVGRRRVATPARWYAASHAASAVPWQSMHWISIAARTSCWSRVLPCTSCEKWQSTQCIPFSRWMSIRWTGTPDLPLELLLGGDGRLHLVGCVLAYASFSPGSGSAIAACKSSAVASGERRAVVVEQIALAVLLEDGAEDPAVAVEVGELRAAICGFRSVRLSRNSGSDQLPRAAASSGLAHQRLDQLPRPSGSSAAAGTSARRRSPRPTTCSRGS